MVRSDCSILSICAQHPWTRFRLLDRRTRRADRLPVACPHPGAWSRRPRVVGVQRRTIPAVPPQPCHCFVARRRSYWSVNRPREIGITSPQKGGARPPPVSAGRVGRPKGPPHKVDVTTAIAAVLGSLGGVDSIVGIAVAGPHEG